MIKNSLFGKISITFSYSALFFLATYFGKSKDFNSAVLFTVGLLLGMAILEADENYLYKFYSEKGDTYKKLATRSLLFLLTLFPLGLFLMTSTGSAVGVGLFVNIISGLALEFYLVRGNPELFHSRFMYQLKRKLSTEEQRNFTLIFIILSILYASMVIFLGR